MFGKVRTDNIPLDAFPDVPGFDPLSQGKIARHDVPDPKVPFMGNFYGKAQK